MKLRSGIYIVPTTRWYIERTVWLIAGFVLLISTALALLVNPLWILESRRRPGFHQCRVYRLLPGGQRAALSGLHADARADRSTRWNLYFMQTDRWYLERRIYLAVDSISPSRRR